MQPAAKGARSGFELRDANAVGLAAGCIAQAAAGFRSLGKILMVMPDVVSEEITAEVICAVAPDGVEVVAVVLDVGDFY